MTDLLSKHGEKNILDEIEVAAKKIYMMHQIKANARCKMYSDPLHVVL